VTTAEKKLVRDFYDNVGWKTVDGVFVDRLRFADAGRWFSRTSGEFTGTLAHNSIRVADSSWAPPPAPFPHPEQAVYSEGFDYRICLDSSMDALRGARAKLGAKGLYVLADITKLPLPDNSVDAVVSLHTLHHVPADEQETALRELYAC
jgi:hypothetical protein